MIKEEMAGGYDSPVYIGSKQKWSNDQSRNDQRGNGQTLLKRLTT